MFEIGPPNYYFLGIACILLIVWFILVLRDKPNEDFFNRCDALEIKIKENNMLGDPPPKQSFTISFLVTVECNKVYNESDARRKSFDLINFATQENEDDLSISSIQVDSIVNNNPKTEVVHNG